MAATARSRSSCRASSLTGSAGPRPQRWKPGSGMKFRVLGCSGGIGARARTTSFLVDEDILIDAGTGVEDLSIEELARIDHVFLTHSHLDHIAALPLLVDSVGGMRDKPLVVHALPETIVALRTHIFNWTIWPDFTE